MASIFGLNITFRSKKEIEKENQLREAQIAHQKEKKGPIYDFIRQRITHLDAEKFVPEYNIKDYDHITLYASKTRGEEETDDVIEKCLEDIANQAMKSICDYVVNIKPIAYSGLQTKSRSGFIIGIGGTGFGFASPDGAYHQYMAMIATGIRKIKTP